MVGRHIHSWTGYTAELNKARFSTPIKCSTCSHTRYSFYKRFTYACTRITFIYSLNIVSIFSRIVNFCFIIVAVDLLSTLFVLSGLFCFHVLSISPFVCFLTSITWSVDKRLNFAYFLWIRPNESMYYIFHSTCSPSQINFNCTRSLLVVC